MRPRIALATLTETRPDFRARRQHLVEEEQAALQWLHEVADVLASPPIATAAAARAFAREAVSFEAQCLVLHLPIWTEPALALKLTALLPLPVLLLGNDRPDTSSTVGLLGAGGALDQAGVSHVRVLGHGSGQSRRQVIAFTRAAAARARLRGQTFGLIGGRSLGIVTATADPAQWHRLFGVDTEHVDQLAIVERAQAVTREEVERHTRWLLDQMDGVEFGGLFTPEALERQVRSYLATRSLIAERGFDFVGVKCQPELSDGYASQCVAHALVGHVADAGGDKPAVVHACEADADGALTMQILHLLTGGQPVALLDVRWFDPVSRVWTLANCGAMPLALTGSGRPDGAGVRLVPHVFGRGGGGALPAVVPPQPVTLARLCRRDGEYWMAAVAGESAGGSREDLGRTTAAFPQAFIRSAAGPGFLQTFGSNHMHLVSGSYQEEIAAFCRMTGIRCEVWA